MGHEYSQGDELFIFFFFLICSLAICLAANLGVQVCMSHFVIYLFSGENTLPKYSLLVNPVV